MLRRRLLIHLITGIFLFSAGNLFCQISSSPPDTVYVGCSIYIFTSTNVIDAKAAANILLQKMIHEWEKNNYADVKIYDQIKSIEEDCRKKRIDLVVLTSYEYLTLKDRINLTPFVAYVTGDRSLDRILLLTRKDSGIHSITDLRNKKIVIYKPLNEKVSITETWFKTALLEKKENYNIYYAAKTSVSNNAAKCISDVFFKKTDAVVVAEKDYEASILFNPQLANELKVIDASKPILYSFLCYTDKIKDHKGFRISELSQKLYEMNKSKVGQQFLNLFRITGFTPFKNEYLKNTEELYDEYKRLSSSKNIKFNK